MTPERGNPPNTTLTPVSALAGPLAALVGGAALVGWAFDVAALKSIRPDGVSMKPNTALAFVLVGLALLLHRPPSALNAQPSTFSLLSRLCAVLAGLIGLLSLAEYTFTWNPGFDHWLFSEPAGTVGTSHAGRMAPDTALCFTLFAIGWDWLHHPSPQRRRKFLVGLLAGFFITTAALIEILSYFMPDLRTHGWGGLTMMALPTAAVFLPLGAALVETALRRRIPEPDRAAESFAPSADPTWLKLLIVFAGLAAGIIATGTVYYRNLEQHDRDEVEGQLSAVAELKVGELNQWRKERRGDAGILFKNAVISELVRRTLEKPEDADAPRQLAMWFEKYGTHFRYDRIRLLDTHGTTRLSWPPVLPPPSPLEVEATAEALQLGQVMLQDFYLSPDDQQVRLSLLIPVFDEADGSRPLGVIVLRINPDYYLYPLIERWPTSSPTAETLLVRKEGGHVIFLNELRFRKEAPLNIRIPLSQVRVPAVQAALGRQGVMDGLDYRDVPVVAALRTIPDSPWALVARIDAAEAFAPLRMQLWRVVGVIGTLLFGTGAGVSLIWRRRRDQYHQFQMMAAQELKENELKFRILAETTTDAHLLFADGRWIDCNRATARIFGCTREQIISAHPSQFSPLTQPDGRPSAETAAQRIHLAFAGQPQVFEWEHCRLDGTPFAAEVSLNRLDLGGRPHLQAIVRDISERKRAATALTNEKQNLDAIFESSPVALFILDEATNIVRVNTAAVALTGGREAAALQHRPGNALHCVHASENSRGCGYGPACPLCPVRNGIEALLANGGTLHGAELPLELIRNGAPEPVWLAIGAETIQLDGRRHLCVAMEDITSRKESEAAIVRQLNELRRWQRVMLDREDRVQSLKREVNELAVRLAEAPRYPSQLNSQPGHV